MKKEMKEKTRNGILVKEFKPLKTNEAMEPGKTKE
jgi:hypothetical protein